MMKSRRLALPNSQLTAAPTVLSSPPKDTSAGVGESKQSPTKGTGAAATPTKKASPDDSLVISPHTPSTAGSSTSNIFAAVFTPTAALPPRVPAPPKKSGLGAHNMNGNGNKQRKPLSMRSLSDSTVTVNHVGTKAVGFNPNRANS